MALENRALTRRQAQKLLEALDTIECATLKAKGILLKAGPVAGQPSGLEAALRKGGAACGRESAARCGGAACVELAQPQIDDRVATRSRK
jgi:hypothetical protein